MNSIWFDRTKRYQLGVGHVQSGKTNVMLEYCKWSIHTHNKSVLFILQNSKPDLEQLIERIKLFNKTLPEEFNLDYAEVTKINIFKGTRVYISLGNFSQLKKFKNLNPHGFHICIDEADLCIKSNNNYAKIEKQLSVLKESANHILGMTATCLAVLYHEAQLATVKMIEPPPNYYGWERIQKLPFKGVGDTYFRSCYEDFLTSKKGLLLHVDKTKKQEQREMSLLLSREYPQILFCVYNGDGIFIRPHAKRKKVLRELKIYDNKPDKPWFITCHSIHDVIQAIKDSKIKHACIIAKNLANRGISFVSTDFTYHLTHQIFNPTQTIHDETLVQTLRILGVYKDSCTLKLYTDQTVIDRVNKVYNVIKAYTDRLSGKTKTSVAKEIDQIYSTDANPNKFSRPKCRIGLMWKRNANQGIAFREKILLEPEPESEEDPEPEQLPTSNND